MLDGGSEDAAGGDRIFGFFQIFRISYLQAKTSPTENSIKSNAIDQFLGIECSSETRCNEVIISGFLSLI